MVQRLMQNGSAEIASVTEPVRLTYLALQKYHFGHLASKNFSAEEIDVAFLLGNAALANICWRSVLGPFFGGEHLIGNDPNFMVKAIADQNKSRTPSFLA